MCFVYRLLAVLECEAFCITGRILIVDIMVMVTTIITSIFIWLRRQFCFFLDSQPRAW